jgi:glycosyltransferase involved in cell wall biosynthesis
MSTSPDTRRSTVGVFIPNRNHAALLPRAMDAILQQSRSADQWIVVDDASTDRSADVLRAYAAKHGRPETIFHTQNIGVIPTFSEVLPKFTTDYLYPAAADDYALPGFFNKALAAADAHAGVGVIFGAMEVRDTQGRLINMIDGPWKKPTYLTPDQFEREFLMRESPLRAYGCSILYRTDALKEIGLERFSELGHGYDNFLWRAIAMKYGAYYIPEALGVWCVQPGSISQSAMRDRASAETIVRLTAKWMRTEEFKNLFSEAYIRSWEARYLNFLKIYCNPVLRPMMDAAVSMAKYPMLRPVVHAGEAVMRSLVLNRSGTK